MHRCQDFGSVGHGKSMIAAGCGARFRPGSRCKHAFIVVLEVLKRFPEAPFEMIVITKIDVRDGQLAPRQLGEINFTDQALLSSNVRDQNGALLFICRGKIRQAVPCESYPSRDLIDVRFKYPEKLEVKIERCWS